MYLFVLKTFYRDWRNSEVRVLALALVIAVAAVTAVHFFTDRIQRVMELQAAEMLGADLSLSSLEPLSPEWIEQAQQLGLQTTQLLAFHSVVLHQDQTALVYLKAVNKGYPLRGQVRVTTEPYSEAIVATTIPPVGTVWLETRLLVELGLQVGDTLQLGEATLTIDKVLVDEPDRSGLFFQLSPRVLMNWQDIAKTQLVTEGSRVRYHLLLAGQPAVIAHYQQWIQPRLQPTQNLRTVDDSRPRTQNAIERAERFLHLAALVVVILAGSAIAVAAYHFAQQQADASAILRCLGCTQSTIIKMYLTRLLILGVLASLIGCGMGWGIQIGLTTLLASYLTNYPLPAPSLTPIGIGLATGLITLFGFSLPPILRIQTVSPLRVLRRELGGIPPKVKHIVLAASSAMILLIFWQAQDTRLATFMVGGLLVTLLLLGSVAYALLYSLRLWRVQTTSIWRFSIANLLRRAPAGSLQLTAFGLSITVLLLLTIVRVDLLNLWQRQLPEGTPNYFVINIAPDTVEPMRERFEQHYLHYTGFYPMVVGRLMAINEQLVSAEHYQSQRAKRFAERTFNLSSSLTLPPDNRIVAGTFNHATAQKQLAVEEGFAKEMEIQLGDTLRFHIGGQEVRAQVTSLRSVQWDSFNVNFFILASPDVTEGLPHTFVTSFYLPPLTSPASKTLERFIPELVRQFPSITVIDLYIIMTQVRQLLDRAALAVQFVFLLAVVAGFVVLYAAIAATHRERLYEAAILRALGASRRYVLTVLLSEFLVLGLLAGILASAIATGLGWLLATQVFDFAYQVNGWLWVVGVLGSGLGIGVAGWWGTRTVLQQPPIVILRQEGGGLG